MAISRSLRPMRVRSSRSSSNLVMNGAEAIQGSGTVMIAIETQTVDAA